MTCSRAIPASRPVASADCRKACAKAVIDPAGNPFGIYSQHIPRVIVTRISNIFS
jgi:hypothetical protein